ncbi:uncharacterized protein NPIL_555861 [Nephila pilipes]|uniref:Gustatory receptor n=1 Tax=Nephila pilipes TaxID=299642 RepID=A0A8X6P9C1_NEPPI|nr:uncharacterized protein NPIL_283941 [Nephila pilipes]GFT23282.1 uncharacterized protein NPIL_132571 [Nephila pilipes]GFT53040.1 uncharacterized protein NPIL_249831 [Nephila pilipes]GFT85960.1 uncharacterized protein NPIL_555861 [Nephila pilipes]
MLKISYILPETKSNKTDALFYGCLISVYAYPIFVSSMMVGLLSYFEAEQYEYIAMFGVVGETAPHASAFVIHCMYNFYLLTLPLLVSFLYVFICYYLNRMITNMISVLLKCRSMEKVNLIFLESMKLFFVIGKVEKAMSVCVFFVVALNLSLSFTSFAYSLGYYDMSTSASSGVLSWFLSNQISFMFIVWSASNVVHESKKLKTTFQLVLNDLELNEQTSMLFLQKVSIFDSVSLTGWNMFEFSKGLILSATGVILTYGLLVLQTENYTPRSTPKINKG